MTDLDSHLTAVAQDERLLLRNAQSGDRPSFEALYRQHVGRIYGLCLRMMGNVEDADDCTQEAFVKAWLRIDSFRGDSVFGTWLHRIAVNECLARQRKFGRERQLLSLIDSSAGISAGPDGQIDELEKAIASLPDGARNVFVMVAVYGYKHEEAGEMLGVAAGTCKAQLHRAKKLLATKLDHKTAGDEK